MRVPFFSLLLGIVALISGCTSEPEPTTAIDIQKRVADDLGLLFADQDPITGPLSLHEAMARAIKYNLDQRVEAMQQAVANRQFDLSYVSVVADLYRRHRLLGAEFQECFIGR